MTALGPEAEARAEAETKVEEAREGEEARASSLWSERGFQMEPRE